jgi:hypothetical protein
MTVNYNAWMMPTYVWATFLFVAAVKRGRLGYYVLCGVLVALSALLRRQAAMIFPLYLALIIFGPKLSFPLGFAPLGRSRALIGYLGGVVLGFVPIALFYLIKGGIGTFISDYFFSGSGWRYVGGELDFHDKWVRLADAFLGFWEFMFLPTLLALMTLARSSTSPRRGETLVGILLGGHFLLSFVGISLGFRFFKGYYLQALPAAALLAAHPRGPLLGWFQRGVWPRTRWAKVSRVLRVAAMTLFIVAAAQPGFAALKEERARRTTFNHVQIEAERIAQVVSRSTKPTDKIWVWGRWAWPVYFHADRLSATYYYKVLGVITTNLTNTWRRPTSMTRFVPHTPHLQIAQELRRERPPILVVAVNEEYLGFTQFEELLQERYEPMPGATYSAFRVYRLKSAKQELAPLKAKPPKANLPKAKPPKANLPKAKPAPSR